MTQIVGCGTAQWESYVRGLEFPGLFNYNKPHCWVAIILRLILGNVFKTSIFLKFWTYTLEFLWLLFEVKNGKCTYCSLVDEQIK
jgi:hypothetical protein